MTATEVFDRVRDYLLSPDPDEYADVWAQDVVVEMPFVPAGGVSRIEGRERLLAMARAGKAAMPVRFDAVRDVVVHQTTDPDVAVVEYAIAGTVRGEPAAARFIAVMRTRDGQVAHWREYQDIPALTAAMVRS
jgi:uncharacterized protein